MIVRLFGDMAGIWLEWSPWGQVRPFEMSNMGGTLSSLQELSIVVAAARPSKRN